VHLAMAQGKHLLLAHEMSSIVGGQDQRYGVEFDKFFACEDGATPGSLLKADIYNEIAVALKGGEWRLVSMSLMVKALNGNKVSFKDATSGKRRPKRLKNRRQSRVGEVVIEPGGISIVAEPHGLGVDDHSCEVPPGDPWAPPNQLERTPSELQPRYLPMRTRSGLMSLPLTPPPPGGGPVDMVLEKKICSPSNDADAAAHLSRVPEEDNAVRIPADGLAEALSSTAAELATDGSMPSDLVRQRQMQALRSKYAQESSSAEQATRVGASKHSPTKATFTFDGQGHVGIELCGTSGGDVVVAEVEADSLAEALGVPKGAKLLEINGVAVSRSEIAKAQIADAARPLSLLMLLPDHTDETSNSRPPRRSLTRFSARLRV